MKIFISILFSVFFVHVALSDINPDPILCLSGHMYCGPGQYVPAGSSECAECPDRCGPIRKMVIDEAVPQMCPSLNNGVFCGYDIPGTRGFFCPGGCIPITSADIGYNRGYEECPRGFPDPESKAQEDNKKCYTTFLFYPGAGATFMGDNFTSDTEYREEKMYYADNSDVFDYNLSTRKHTLNTDFIGTGSQVPRKTHYYFDNWNWDTENGMVTVKADTDITSTSDIPATYANSVSKRLYAKWRYKVQYHIGNSISTQGFDATSGEPFVLKKNTELYVWNFVSGTPTTATLIEEGKIFKGWCVDNLSCSDTELLHPADTICDVDNCGDKKVTPINKYVNLYAQFDTCDAEANLVADVNNDECVCAKGYYGSETTGCTTCGNGMTTEDIGTPSSDGCKHFFRYKVGDDYKTWNWPTDKLDLGNITNVSGLP